MRFAAVVLILALCAPGPVLAAQSEAAALPETLTLDGQVVGQRAGEAAGEICRLCYQRTGRGDPFYLIRGQRVAFHRAEMGAGFDDALRQLLAQLTPRSGFFGMTPEQSGLSPIWFLVGSYVLVGLVFAAVCAHRAVHAGHNPYAWFAVGLLFNAFGYLVLLTRPQREVHEPGGVPAGLRKVAHTHSPRPCPSCGAWQHPSAARCAACGAEIKPQFPSEAERLRASRPN